MAEQNDIGLIGLAVMGQNLVLNMANRGFSVGVFNRTTSKVDEFLAGPAKGKSIHGYHSLPELIASLKSPRKIMMMVKAGPAVDELLGELEPHLSRGDILIDGGNTHFPDTERRVEAGGSQGPALRRHRRLRRRRGGAQGAEHHAGRHERRMAAHQDHFSGDRRQGRAQGGYALLRVDRRGGLGPLRQNDPQRHRIRRHAADLRGLLSAQARAGPRQRRAVRRLRCVEPDGAGKLLDRDHPRHLQRQGRRMEGIRSSTKFSIRPSRKGPANG